MSDSGNHLYGVAPLGGGSGGYTVQQISMRTKLIAQINPVMAQDPTAITTMAMSPMDTPTLLSSVGQHYAMIQGDKLSERMKNMSDVDQRGLWGQLTPGQQSSLEQLGYKVPQEAGSPGWLGAVGAAGGSALGWVSGGLSKIPGVSAVGGGALEALQWVGNVPGYVYRSVRTTNDAGQAMGLIGAIGGIAAVMLAPVTGGGSVVAYGTMMTLGMAAAGGLAGAVAGSAVGSIASSGNPHDWMRAFSTSWDGEKTFDRPSQAKVKVLLADPRMQGLAHDLASTELDLVELAHEMAGQRDISMGTEMHKIEELATKMATKGTPLWDTTVNAMIAAVQDPIFQQAVQTLVDGKMSLGRDLADKVPYLEKHSTLYNVLSGGVDAVFTIAADPTLMATEGVKAVVAARDTVRIFDGAEMATQFLEVSTRSKGVARYHTAIAHAVSRAGNGGLALMRSLNPSFERNYDSLVTHAKMLVELGPDRGGITQLSDFGVEHLRDYYTGWSNLEPAIQGMGTVVNSRGMQLMSMSVSKQALREVRQQLRTITTGLSDVRTERRVSEILSKLGNGWESILPATQGRFLTSTGMVVSPWEVDAINPNTLRRARKAGELLDKSFIGRPVTKIADVMISLTTMSLSGRTLALTGENAARDIRAFSELGRYGGMPSWARQAWADTILAADSEAVKFDAVQGYIANILKLGGMDQTKEGAALLNEYLVRSKQIYTHGDTMMFNDRAVHVGMGVSQQADRIVVPNMKELLRGTTQGMSARLLGITDLPVIEPIISKVWKPIVLLRIGFIPRAAGEELAAFLARGGMGSLTQEAGGRFLGRYKAYEAAVIKAENLKVLTMDEERLLLEAQPLMNRISTTAEELAKVKLAQSLNRQATLTPAEQLLLAQGPSGLLPKHVTPILKIAQRLNHEEVAFRQLRRYGDFLRDKMTEGLGRDGLLEERLGAMAGQALDAPRRETPTWLMEKLGIPADATYKAMPIVGKPNLPLLNFADKVNAIALGKEYSIRRMLRGGVHDELVDAGREWFSRHATTIMRDVSAGTHGAIASPWEKSDLVKVRSTVDQDGKIRDVYVHRVTGERVWVGNSGGEDTPYLNSYYDAISTVLHDPVHREVVMEHISRMRSSDNVTEEGLTEAAKLIHSMAWSHGDDPLKLVPHSAAARHTQAIVTELIGPVNIDQWEAMLTEFRRTKFGDVVADALEWRLPRNGAHDIDSVRGALEAHMADLTPNSWAHGELQLIVDGLDVEGRKLVAYARSFPDRADRAFVQQFLHHELVAGEQGAVAKHIISTRAEQVSADEAYKAAQVAYGKHVQQRTVAAAQDEVVRGAELPPLTYDPAAKPVRVVVPDRPLPLYDSWDQIAEDAKGALRGKMLGPYGQELGVEKSRRSLLMDAQGQYIDTAQRRGTINLFEVRPLRFASVDDIKALSVNKELIERNRAVIEGLLGRSRLDTALVADYELAQELNRVRFIERGFDPARAGRPRMMRREREVVDGRVHGTLYPHVDSKVNGEAQLWFQARDTARPHLMPFPDASVDPIADWADKAFENVKGVLGRGQRSTMHAKMRMGEPDANGVATYESLVYRYNSHGDRLAVMPDEPLSPSEMSSLFDSRHNKISVGDPTFYEPAPDLRIASEGLNNEVVTNTLRDVWDNQYGKARIVRSRQPAELGHRGLPMQSQERVLLSRSSLDDVRYAHYADLPNWSLAQLTRDVPIGKFEDVINFGFDRVIGPAIDGIVRKPMAFHAFAQRYTGNMKMMQWLVDPAIESKIRLLALDYSAAWQATGQSAEVLADRIRAIARYDTNDANALNWSTNNALAWLRGHDPQALDDLMLRVTTASQDAARAGRATAASRAASIHATQLQRADPKVLQAALAQADGPQAFLKALENELPANAFDSVDKLKDAIFNNRGPLGQQVMDTPGAVEDLVAYRANIDHLSTTAADAAATAAIADVVPYLDSHEFKTQFADYGKGFMPFWYAEENFMKRWARGLAGEGPAIIRRAQLTYMGMKNAGIVRTDPSGRDWFVYPGSGLLQDVISAMLPGELADGVGVMFQSPTDQVLPGMNSRFGTPSFNPLVSLPMGLLAAWQPELQPVERALLGDYASGRNAIEQVIPGHLRNLFDAVLFQEDGAMRYASAQTSAMAYLDASGHGLSDNATAPQKEQFMDRVKHHARIIVLAQAIAGFATPGSPSTLETGQSGVGVFNVDDPAAVLADEYQTLVRLLGVEEGTAKYLELNPDNTIEDIVNPLAFTIGKNQSVSGAPLPATEGALQFYTDNEDYLKQFPNAGPWLMPQNYDGGSRSQYAYDQQTIAGLRKRRTPEEFLAAMKFKEGSAEYFTMQTKFKDDIAAAANAGNKQLAQQLTGKMNDTLLMYRAAHPMFTEQLQGSATRQRRQDILNELHSIMRDPAQPASPQLAPLTEAVQAYDSYKIALAELSLHNTALARRQTDDLKLRFQTFMDSLTMANPGIMSFWVSVLRPEASLD